MKAAIELAKFTKELTWFLKHGGEVLDPPDEGYSIDDPTKEGIILRVFYPSSKDPQKKICAFPIWDRDKELPVADYAQSLRAIRLTWEENERSTETT